MRQRPVQDEPAILSATCVAVWTLVAAGSLLVPHTGAAAATTLSFAAATLLVVRVAGVPRPLRSGIGVACAAASGFASYPAWVVAIATVGLAVGMPPRTPVAPGAATALDWISVAVLAPCFEELLYRRLLLPALRRRFGVVAAIVATSALFAIPHLESWHVLGTFAVGLALGAVFVATGDVWLCIALHAGVNAAALAGGSPPVRLALDPLAAAIAGPVLLALAATPLRVAFHRRAPQRSAAHA
jgi:membrane protease YdiL (CAAX protease family)